MSEPQFKTWQTIQAEVLRRIYAREWPPGHTIPNEVSLCEEFGCARATVNRALQSLAETGVLERRRKAGTRVALRPVSRATLEIPLIKEEVENMGKAYGYHLTKRTFGRPPSWAQMPADDKALFISARHLSDKKVYVVEERWISTINLPQAAAERFEHQSPNEWLIAHVPYTHGDISFAATSASAEIARAFGCRQHVPLLTIERITWDEARPLTAVRLHYSPGHQLHTRIGPKE